TVDVWTGEHHELEDGRNLNLHKVAMPPRTSQIILWPDSSYTPTTATRHPRATARFSFSLLDGQSVRLLYLKEKPTRMSQTQ
ncbi:MAG TPA: hypothetical protein VJV04_00805, partial [Nitrospiraceae bacterium]|nr:hypothetical protein [Nitrospiraceae bacterium]